MNKFFHPLAMIAILIVIALIVAAWLLPMQLAHNVKLAIEHQTGRSFSVKGSAGWTLQPSPALILHNVQLDGVSAISSEILVAKSMTWNVNGSIAFEDADVTIAINEQGRSNLLIGDENESVKIAPRNLSFYQSRFHYVDLRSNLDFTVSDISGEFRLLDSGMIEGSGSASLNSRTVQFATSLGSLPRLTIDGSPFELNINSPQDQLSFSGRLAMKDNLNLAGQATIDAADLAKFAAWTNIGFASLKSGQKLSISSAIEIQNTNYSFNSAQIELGKAKAQGDFEISFAAEKPSFDAKLGVDNLDLNMFTKIDNPNWSETPFDLASLQSLNGEFQVAANKISYGTLTSGPGKMSGSLNNGMLAAQMVNDSGANANIKFDGNAIDLKAHLEKASLPLATFSMDMDVQSSGKSEAEMVSKLAGNAKASISSLRLNELNATGSVGLEIKDGIATISENSLQNTAQKMSIDGEIDILRKIVSISTAALDGKKLLISGPWLKPEISTIAATLQ